MTPDVLLPVHGHATARGHRVLSLAHGRGQAEAVLRIAYDGDHDAPFELSDSLHAAGLMDVVTVQSHAAHGETLLTGFLVVESIPLAA